MIALPLTGRRMVDRFRAQLDRHAIAKRVVPVVFVLASTALLTAIYTRLSMTSPINSDQASQALQGVDLSSGNVLLSGWTLSTISLYVPDLLLYGALLPALGLQPVSIHMVNALMYAIVVIAAVVLARGTSSGRRAVAGLITAVLLIAPQLGLGVNLLLVGGSHVGVALLALLALVVVDRSHGGYFGLFLISLIVTAAVFSNGLAYVILVGPLVVVCGWRLVRRQLGFKYDAGLLAATAIAVLLTRAIGFFVARYHGYRIYPLAPTLAQLGDVPKYLGSAVAGLLALFGASPGGGAFDYVAEVAHAVGLTFAVAAACYVAWRWIRGRESDRVTELLLVSMAIDLVAFLFIAHGDTNRYLIPLFIFAAVLAGRAGAGFVARHGVPLPAAAVAAVYCILLLASLVAPAAPTNQPWETWLLDQHLYSGLGSYWQASVATVDTGGRVRIRPILSDGIGANGYAWESKASWYTTRQLGDARFVVYDVNDRQFGIDRSNMESVFGLPSETMIFGSVEVLVWDKNLGPLLRH